MCGCGFCQSVARKVAEADNGMQGQSVQAFTSSTPTIAALLEGFSWTGTVGQPATVLINFTKTVEGGKLFSSTQRTQALEALQQWSNVANITYATSSAPDLTFSQDNLGDNTAGLASTFFNGDQIISSEIQIDNSISNLSKGSFGYLTLLHEVGHALGLKHPGNYGSFDNGPFLTSAQDTIERTVMSYNDSASVDATANPPITPMVYDIQAIQTLYGANRNYNSGNNLYSLNGSKQTLTFWDGGGRDTLSAAAYTGGGVNILLKEGVDNMIKVGQSIAFIAIGANIENAVGSASNDTLVGDDNANEIFGGNGSDNIRGGGGNDTLYGGDGVADPDDSADTVAGENGSDLIYGNTGDDVIYGGAAIADAETGSDTIFGGFGRDAIYGNAGNDSLYGGGASADPSDLADTIYGGFGNDYILGNGGNDVLYGGGAASDPSDGGDTIIGGVGDDVILGNGGNDSIVAGPGNDQLHAGLGDDIYVFSSDGGIDVIQFFEGAGVSGGDVIQLQSNINGSGITTAEQAVAAITVAGDGSAVLLLGGSNLITIQGVGSALTAGDFQII